jgi:hypothetical protein
MPEEAAPQVNPWGPGGARYQDWDASQWAAGDGASLTPEPPVQLQAMDRERIVLPAPPLIAQSGVTCWAATLASWRKASGRKGGTFKEVMDEYKAQGLVGDDGSMTYANGVKILTKEGMTSASMEGEKITYKRLKGLLQPVERRNYIYLVYQPPGATFSHAVLAYGIERTPSDEMALTMNPMYPSVPKHLFLADLKGQRTLLASIAGAGSD